MIKDAINFSSSWKLSTKLAISFSTLLMLTSGVLTTVLYLRLVDGQNLSLRNRLHDVLSFAAPLVDGDYHSLVTSSKDYKSPFYNVLSIRLLNIQNTIQHIKRIYTLRQQDDGTLVYVIDINLETQHEPGSEFFPLSPLLLNGLNSIGEPTIEQGIFSDSTGAYISGFAPIYDQFHELDGVLGIDFDASDVVARRTQTLLLALITFFISLPFSWLISLSLAKRLTAPVNDLMLAAKQLAEGNLEKQVPVRSQDELGMLAQAFNGMSVQLRQTLKGLQKEIVEHKLSEESLFKRNLEIGLLYRGSTALGISLDIELIHKNFYTIISQSMPCDFLVITSCDKQDDLLYFVVGWGKNGKQLFLKGNPKKPYAPACAEVLKGVIQSGEPLCIYPHKKHQAYFGESLLEDSEGVQAKNSKLRSAMIVPIKQAGEVLGLIQVASRKENAFTVENLNFLNALAPQIGVVTANSQLYQQSKNRVRQLTALREIDKAIISRLDLKETLTVLLVHLSEILNADAAAILILDPETQRLKFLCERGFTTNALQNTNIKVGKGYAGRAASERQIIIVPDIKASPGSLLESPELIQEGFQTYIGTPLIIDGQIKGVLEVFQREPFSPTEEWLDILDSLSTQTAVAIDNQQLINDLQLSNIELSTAYDDTIESLSAALDLRDEDTEGHSIRVTKLTLILAQAAGVPDTELENIRRGALLHDIGKIGISDGILRKKGALTDSDWELMRQHPSLAYKTLSPIAFLKPSLDIPYCHHEKWDGSGYPRGLKGEEIPLAARIFAITDVWDALLSDRPYRKAWTPESAFAHIRAQSGIHFQPELVEIFLNYIAQTHPDLFLTQ